MTALKRKTQTQRIPQQSVTSPVFRHLVSWGYLAPTEAARMTGNRYPNFLAHFEPEQNKSRRVFDGQCREVQP